ncbi:MAG: Cys-Gln thioester bond-forming surface protein [Anaerotignum sp.]|nr:Cys-Gln thioester bond-forming surface protein [Anaerotignum sp.]
MQYEMKAAVKETEDGKYTIGGVTFDSREAAETAIDALNDGDAQLVTNAAIWSFTDGYAGKEKVNDTDCGFGNYAFGDFVADRTDVATLQMMYQYLMEVANADIEQSKVPAAEGEAVTEKTETYVEDVSLKVYDKVSDAENNKDDNKDNDVYSTDLSIKMVVTKDGTLKVYNGAGEEIASADISNSNGASTTVTFEGLTLAENEKVDIKLEHVEYMNAGVYVLEPTQSAYDQYGAYGPMSPLVGLKTDTVKTTTSYSFEFDVNEDDKTVVKKSKRTTTVTTPEAEKPDAEGSHSRPDSPADIPDAEVPLTDVSEENVPMADTPQTEAAVGEEFIVDEDVPLADIVLGAEDVSVIAETGDSNHMTAGFGGMLAALAGMMMLRKKKEN